MIEGGNDRAPLTRRDQEMRIKGESSGELNRGTKVNHNTNLF